MMIKSLAAFLLVFAASPVLSFDLQSIDAAGIKEMSSAAVEVPAAPKAASQYLWMSVRSNPSFKEAEANDYGARIETRVRETIADSFDVSMRTDSNSSWASIRKSGSYYSLSGAGIYLNMSGSNGSYFVNGNVSENGKTTMVSVNVSKRFDDFSYNVFGNGLNMYTDRNSLNGNYDPDRFSKKAVAAVTSLVLALQVEKGQPAKEVKAVRNSERIWLTIRPGFGGWNSVEATDPFSRITVGLRKIFDREYDAEIETDNNRFSARVSGFFTRRYELRGGRTDLRMEEWAGSWTLTGNVETQGGQQAVKLELRDRFGDGSFYVWDTAINLTIDRSAVNGTVDTKVYPKEVVGAITALVMAWQQDNPNPR